MAAKQTVLGQGTHVVGEVRGDDALVVYGRVEGRIQISEELTIEPGAVVQADVEAKTVVVAGVLVGSIVATESVRLTSKARVVGSITAPSVGIEAGAAYRGRIEMGEVNVQKSASASASADKGRSALAAPAAAAKAPPRLAPPSKVAPAAAPAAPARPATVASAPARSVSAPPRPVTAVAQQPAWARKKATKRR
jgi:cytoskeletal protein CcmA (bactofilin family)